MVKIAIVGKGNVASHFSTEFKKTEGICAVEISSRTFEGLESGFDIVLITVSDSAIATVAAEISVRIPSYEGVVAHTAGSIEMDILSPYFKHYGVFYPLQTFSKGIPVSNFREIPFFVEGSDRDSYDLLKKTASRISDFVYDYDSAKREKMHLASVFANNFVNAMYQCAEEILGHENIPFQVVHALIRQTAEKALSFSPSSCQTGPARRGDIAVMKKHLSLLEDSPKLYEIYSLLSQYIFEKFQYEQDRL